MNCQVAMSTYGPVVLDTPVGVLPSLNGLYLTHLPFFLTCPGGHLPFLAFAPGSAAVLSVKPAPDANADLTPEFLLDIVKS